MVSYRGAYMMALGMIIHDGLNQKTVFMWTLPMFHCNGKIPLEGELFHGC